MQRKIVLWMVVIVLVVVYIFCRRAVLACIAENKDLIQTIATALIAVFTYTLWIATTGLYKMALKQAKDMEASLNVSRDAVNAAMQANNLNREIFLASERPWIPAKVEVVETVHYDQYGLHMKFRFRLKNIGKSPAKHVMPHARLYATILGENNNLIAVQREVSEGARKGGLPLGPTLFPEQEVDQVWGFTFSTEQITATKMECLLLSIVGVIDYSFVFEEGHHQTGFIYEIRRVDTPRPLSSIKNRSPSVICPDEGDIPASEIVLQDHFVGGFFAD